MTLRNLLEEEERPSFVLHQWACDCIERLLGWVEQDGGPLLEAHLRMGAQIVREWIEGRRPTSEIHALRQEVVRSLLHSEQTESAHALRAMLGLVTPSWEQPRVIQPNPRVRREAKAPLPAARLDIQNALYIGGMTQAAAAQRADPLSSDDAWRKEEEWQIQRLRDLDALLRSSRRGFLLLLKSYLVARKALLARLQESLEERLYDE